MKETLYKEDIFDEKWWSEDEKTHRWALASSVKIHMFYEKKVRNLKNFSFQINAISKGKYEIFINDKIVAKGDFEEVGEYYDVRFSSQFFKEGKNILLIKTNIKKMQAGPRDPRLITFSIKDFSN